MLQSTKTNPTIATDQKKASRFRNKKNSGLSHVVKLLVNIDVESQGYTSNALTMYLICERSTFNPSSSPVQPQQVVKSHVSDWNVNDLLSFSHEESILVENHIDDTAEVWDILLFIDLNWPRKTWEIIDGILLYDGIDCHRLLNCHTMVISS